MNMGEGVVEVALCDIHANPYQPRFEFSEENIKELADSIRAIGLLQPPLVRQIGDRYELIAGERRFRACELAGLKKIPVFVKNSDGEHSAEAALIENIQRVDLNPIEVARALRSLIDQFGFNQEELALRIGKKRSTVANYLRLLSLSSTIQESVQTGQISMGHAKALLSLPELEKRTVLHQKIIREGLTVRETEQTVKKMEGNLRKQNKSRCPGNLFLEEIARNLEKKLGTKVSIQPKDKQGHRGQIIIDYYNLDDLDDLMDILSLTHSH